MKYIYLVIGRVRYEGQDILSAHLTQESADKSAAALMAVDAMKGRRRSYSDYDTQAIAVEELKAPL